jgi:uncharacterized membrane protein
MDNLVETPPPKREFLINFAVVLACLLVFAVLVYIAYVMNQPDSVNAEAAKVRAERYQALRLETADTLHTYAWVDQEAGVVRIPVERAVQLTGERLQRAQRQD